MSIHTIIELSELVKVVNSKESADAAAPKVKADIERLFAIEKSLDIENMPDSVAIKLQAEFRFTIRRFMCSMQVNASCLEENKCYGSDALMEAMSRLTAAEKRKGIALKMEECRACLDEVPIEELRRIKKELVTPEVEALGMEFLTVAETLRKQKNYHGSTALENTRIGSVIGEVTDTLDKDLWNDIPQVTPLPAGGEAGE